MKEKKKVFNRFLSIALLTGGNDPPYVLPLTKAIVREGVRVDFIGNNDMADSDVARYKEVKYFNLRGSQNESVNLSQKFIRICKYYLRLLNYTIQTKNKIFHIIWLNKFIFFDRTLLNLFYKFNGKKIVYTAHNVNERKRNGNDSFLNKFSLSFMYRVVDHIFVHTEKSKIELQSDFNISKNKISVIPFGINDTAPVTGITSEYAKHYFGFNPQQKIILFFGQIAQYKGLEYLVDALKILREKEFKIKLLIAGKIKSGNEDYWHKIERKIKRENLENYVTKKIGFIPDEKIELFFKAADVLALPYVSIFQSGVLILSYFFGLPVIGTRVGEFEKDIIWGKTGFICSSRDSCELAQIISEYFDSKLYKNLIFERKKIHDFALQKYSWESVGKITFKVYKSLIR
jgi:glycosyltransferase involved in cell wall biosynthesis